MKRVEQREAQAMREDRTKSFVEHIMPMIVCGGATRRIAAGAGTARLSTAR